MARAQGGSDLFYTSCQRQRYHRGDDITPHLPGGRGSVYRRAHNDMYPGANPPDGTSVRDQRQADQTLMNSVDDNVRLVGV